MIGFVRCECIIYDAHSLKEKRSVLKSVITRIKQQYNVSVAELDHHDVWQRTEIGIVSLSTNRTGAEKELQRAIGMIESRPEIELANTVYEWL
ncbi:DUF503 domain-containing protein [Pseudalkalibacillus caeni]|uniref:DUF503 family protein n=1 Tax=Exobacillus caeni TaxID=2574798 RepID=A0A5R9F2U3_9BACL|nr:DUF503 family protein [Pseudalkalibacillus caeni]TLS37371.1 DUF503 family protein [Pseudalkalibacillus caeni]